MKKIGEFKPDLTKHPADIIREFAGLLGINQDDYETKQYHEYRWILNPINRESKHKLPFSHFEIRPPQYHKSLGVDLEGTQMFHHDSNKEKQGMVCWSNRETTELRECMNKHSYCDADVCNYTAGEITSGDPFDIVEFDNAEYAHRTPKVVSKDRWFIRAYRNLKKE